MNRLIGLSLLLMAATMFAVGCDIQLADQDEYFRCNEAGNCPTDYTCHLVDGVDTCVPNDDDILTRDAGDTGQVDASDTGDAEVDVADTQTEDVEDTDDTRDTVDDAEATDGSDGDTEPQDTSDTEDTSDPVPATELDCSNYDPSDDFSTKEEFFDSLRCALAIKMCEITTSTESRERKLASDYTNRIAGSYNDRNECARQVGLDLGFFKWERAQFDLTRDAPVAGSTYHADVAEDCLKAIERLEIDPFHAPNLEGCLYVFGREIGTTEGGTCHSSYECASRICEDTVPACGTGTCLGTAGDEGDCDSPSTGCPPFVGLSCVTVDEGENQMRCRPRGEFADQNSRNCEVDWHCPMDADANLICVEGDCLEQDLVPLGEPCDDDDIGCVDGFCDAGVCEPFVTSGGSCRGSFECAGNLICSPSSTTCTERAWSGDDCSEKVLCGGGYACVSGNCQTPCP